MINQDTEAWHEMRRTRIGASDAAQILNVSPYGSAYMLWEEKLGLRPPKQMNFAMSEGKRKEENGRRKFEQIIGKSVNPDVIVHPVHDYLMASLDGISEDRQLICEIKHPGKKDHEEALSGRIPEKYYPQVQMQMEVSGLPINHYFSVYGEDACVVVVERNRAFINQMMPKLHEFYKCMITFKPPELTEMDLTDMSSDEIWHEISNAWKMAYESLKEFEATESELRAKLIDLARDRNCRGNGVIMKKHLRKGSIDYAAISEIKEINLDKYRKPNLSYWNITTEKS